MTMRRERKSMRGTKNEEEIYGDEVRNEMKKKEW